MRSTEQPRATVQAEAPELSNVGLSADIHCRAAVGELGRSVARTLRMKEIPNLSLFHVGTP